MHEQALDECEALVSVLAEVPVAVADILNLDIPYPMSAFNAKAGAIG